MPDGAGAGRANPGHVYHDRVRPADAGRSVVDYHALRFPHSTRSAWEEHVASGRVLVNGRPAASDQVLRTGDRLEFHRPAWVEPAAPATFDVAHEDDDVLIVVKPAGLQVLPAGPFVALTLLALVRDSSPARRLASPVHRLGRGTSGLVVFGKTPAALSALTAQLRAHALGKLYLALVEGTALPASFAAREPVGPLVHPLGSVHGVSPAGRQSLTRVRVLRRDPGESLSLVAAWPISGRPNQIRIHLAAHGAPLVGDPLFLSGGGLAPSARPGDIGYRLHAVRVRLRHPRSGSILKVRSLPATDFFTRP